MSDEKKELSDEEYDDERFGPPPPISSTQRFIFSFANTKTAKKALVGRFSPQEIEQAIDVAEAHRVYWSRRWKLTTTPIQKLYYEKMRYYARIRDTLYEAWAFFGNLDDQYELEQARRARQRVLEITYTEIPAARKARQERLRAIIDEIRSAHGFSNEEKARAARYVESVIS